MIDFAKLRELAEPAGEELGEGEWYRPDDYFVGDRSMVYADAEFSAAVNPDTVLDLLDRIETLQASLDRLHGAKFSDRDYAALVDRAERNEADAAIGRAVLEKTVVLDGSVEGMTVLTLAADAEGGMLEAAVRNAVAVLSVNAKEQS